MIRLIILSIIVTNLVWAQTDAEFKRELELILLDRQQTLDWEQVVKKTRVELESTVKAQQIELSQIESTLINRPAQIQEALEKINKTLDTRPSSKRKRFYKCIKDTIQSRGVAVVDICSNDTKGFEAQDLEFIKKLRSTIAFTPKELELKKKKVSRDLYMSEERLKNTDKNLVQAANSKIISQKKEKLLETRMNDQKVINSNAKFINCNALTPEISLEEKTPFPGANFKGPFFGVPRDNQDGLGTCYANTAKNLLVSTSQGEDVASFLDLALIFKEEDLSDNGLDAGGSCTTLDKMEKKGYCPQGFAPAENGEKNSFTDGLGGNSGSIYDQSVLVDLLQKFFISQEVLEKKNKKFSDEALSQANLIIHNLKTSPNVKIPLPVARFPIPNAWKLKEAMHLKFSGDGIKQDELLSDYKEAYQQFYPLYVKSVFEGKTREEIFSQFKLKMNGFIEKYDLGNSMDSWKNIFMSDTQSDWTDPNLKKEIALSMKFMKAMSGKTEVSDEDFIKDCEKTASNFEFLSSLQPLVKHLQSKGVDAKALYDENGRFKSQVDLMQLAVAPACLNPANRVMPKNQILCETGHDTVNKIKDAKYPVDVQKKMLRERIVASLVQGYALGNTFERHINTIVGMRFNSVTNSCELKIRESQTGTSSWQSEDRIFNKIEALTEVRRR